MKELVPDEGFAKEVSFIRSLHTISSTSRKIVAIYLQGVPGLSWLSFVAAAAMVLAAPSVAIVGVDERLFDEVLEPLPDFFLFFFSPLQTQNTFEITYEQNTLKIIKICSPV